MESKWYERRSFRLLGQVALKLVERLPALPLRSPQPGGSRSTIRPLARRQNANSVGSNPVGSSPNRISITLTQSDVWAWITESERDTSFPWLKIVIIATIVLYKTVIANESNIGNHCVLRNFRGNKSSVGLLKYGHWLGDSKTFCGVCVHEY